jgi:hypothetical protein
MGYVVEPECAAVFGNRPYRVVYYDLEKANRRKRVQRFKSFDDANRFKRRLPLGSQPLIRLVQK